MKEKHMKPTASPANLSGFAYTSVEKSQTFGTTTRLFPDSAKGEAVGDVRIEIMIGWGYSREEAEKRLA